MKRKKLLKEREEHTINLEKAVAKLKYDNETLKKRNLEFELTIQELKKKLEDLIGNSKMQNSADYVRSPKSVSCKREVQLEIFDGDSWFNDFWN